MNKKATTEKDIEIALDKLKEKQLKTLEVFKKYKIKLIRKQEHVGLN